MRHSPRLWIGLLAVALAPLGCSATGIGKPFGSPMKTVASVADQPLPAVTGEPGSAIAADDPEPEIIDRRPKLDGKISGRVVDHRGDPAEGVIVRVADSGLRGGKVVRARTDRAGGFTLRGLRPGTDYTVIAELEDEQGLMTGRVAAQAPETGVEIALGDDQETDPIEPRSARATSQKKVATVSDRANQERTSRSLVNDDDIMPARTDRDPVVKPARPSGASAKNAWRRGGEESDPPAAAAPVRQSSSRSEDDDENPLPPALERSPRIEEAPKTSRRIKKSEANGQLVAAPPTEAEPKPEPQVLAEAPAESVVESTSTPAVVAAAPVVTATVVEAEYDPFALVNEADAVVAQATDAPRPQPLGQVQTSEPRQLGVSTRQIRRGPSDAQVINKVSLSSVNASNPTSTEELLTKSPASRLRPVARNQRYAGSKTGPGPMVDKLPLNGDTTAACRFDQKLDRLIDFRLVDLQGRPTRYTDIDSDFVLLDFWGSWCEPCKESIPHFLELQKRFSTSKLQIIGVACERGPLEGQAVTAASAARKLKITYPVLVTDADKGCPLQQAMHVQAYPTMILLDRQGRIVWRAAGATEANLARLDRVLASSTAGVAAKATQARR